ncbi:hypothetical protein COS75_02515 [Candidatus Pacearchaeota archaeon CG06_land_8_20_14_3_00_35_12]|nr:MAG: hypothetical protein COS75_02515 [Candidatus Pacearchaeota archaeon CG06_land_8_20_14_3_00_35_12]
MVRIYNGLNGPIHLGKMYAKVCMHKTCLRMDFTSLSDSKKEGELNEMLKKGLPDYKREFDFNEGLYVNNFKAAFWKKVEEELHIHVHHTDMIGGNHAHNYHHS